jgi:hypothetical protein
MSIDCGLLFWLTLGKLVKGKEGRKKGKRGKKGIFSHFIGF